MAIEGEMVFESVGEEDFNGLIEEGNCDKFLVRRVSHRQNVLCELQCSCVL